VSANIEHRLGAIRSDWAGRGFSFEYWIDPPGQTWRDFVHDVDEVLVLVEGEIELRFLGRSVRPAVGEEVLIPAGAKHTVVNSGNTSNRWCFGYKRNSKGATDG
jgi:mannose-6-phosphate isomerase-like protein (cupin superfamily)